MTHRASSTTRGEQEWRGVAAERTDDELTTHTSTMLQARSRRLLGNLIRPYRRVLWLLLVVVLVENAARLSIPYLVKEGIDRGIPPIQESRDATTLVTIVAMLLFATLVQAVARQRFLVTSGPRRAGRAVRGAAPGVRALPAAEPGVPRRVHVRPRHLSSDLRHGGHRRDARDRVRRSA